MTERNPIEILAPVGGREHLLAAVRCGADAVYLGGKGFNARRNAENFEENTLSEVVSYCHARNTRVYVTLNTLVMDDETPALLAAIDAIAKSGADAVITQDLAVAALSRACCPSLALHASTQMAIHNAAGARMLESLGFSRVVLARELTLEEICEIRKNSEIELEAFVHGALCTSVSGACYLSSVLGGRSGNRGLCAQPCRLDFRFGQKPFALSLKDMSHLEHAVALAEAGVCALKIEGRMKRPEYVAAAVTAAKKALQGIGYDGVRLQKVFSRSGFTDGYLTGRRTNDMQGVRLEEDKRESRRSQWIFTAMYCREHDRVPVRMALNVREIAVLTVTDGAHTTKASSPLLEGATPLTPERAREVLKSTGGTPFSIESLELEGNLALPAAALSRMRRETLAALLALREKPAPHPVLPLVLPRHAPHDPGTHAYRVRAERLAQIPSDESVAARILPVSEILAHPECLADSTLIAELPALIFPGEEDALLETLRELRERGLSAALAENLGAIEIARAAGLAVHGGHGLNLTNTRALEEAARLGLADATVSFELRMEKIGRLGASLPRGALVYGRLPLMRLRRCPAQSGCATCDGRPKLIDRMGATFPLLCSEKRYTTLLNSVPLAVRPLPGTDFSTLYFTLESPSQCRAVFEAYKNRALPEGMHTTGLYNKTLY